MGLVLSILVGVLTAAGFATKRPKIGSVPAPGSKSISGETKPRRAVQHADALTLTPDSSIRNATDIMGYAAKKYGSRPLIGTRRLLKTHKEEKTLKKMVGGKQVEEKKTWTFYEMSDYEWLSAGDFGKIVAEIGSGITSLGYKSGDICVIFASTSADWLSMANGCWHQGLTISTAYDTLGVSGLAYSVQETEAKLLFTNAELLHVVEQAIAQAPSLETVFYNGEIDSDIKSRFEKDLPHIRLLSMDELRAKGCQDLRPSENPGADEIACIMYTSGSTGNPKGVIITHQNIIAAVSGAGKLLDGITLKDGSDTFLAMLPQAHILELTVEMTCLTYGVRLGYGSPRTLLSTSCKNCEGDLATLKPTIMAGVPAVWDGIRKAIMGTTSKLPPTAKRVFDLAYKLKWFLMQNGLPGVTVLDRAVFNKIKNQFGGRLIAALVGGAPLSADAQQFISITLCPLISGYGSTETTGVISVDCPYPNVAPLIGSVGQVLSCCEVKLVDVPGSNYSVTNTPYPEGEIWVRGGNVTKGYYKQPKTTAEAYHPEGWFMTGDVGQFDENGNLKVTSRIKSLIKLRNGEYVAVERLESFFALSKYVDRVLIYADSEHDQTAAVVVPRLEGLKAFATDNNLFDHEPTLVDFSKSKECTQEVLRDIQMVAKSNGLAKGETPVGVYLSPDEWTPQNQRLTSAMKLKRKELNTEYMDQIKKIYGDK